MGIQRKASWLLGAALLGSAAISVHAAPLMASGTVNASSIPPSSAATSTGQGHGKGQGKGQGQGNGQGNGNNASPGWSDVPNDSGAAGEGAVPDSSGMTYGADAYTELAAANDFYGLVPGNDKGIDDLGLSWGSGWMLAAKDNTGGNNVSNQVLGIRFSVDAGAQAPAGHWTLTGTGMGTDPVLLDMVVALKSGNGYGLYYFHDVAFDGSGGGTWLSPSFNVNGVRQDLSHLSVYVRPAGDGGFNSSPQGGLSEPAGGLASPPQSHAVPEPGSLALVGAALGAAVALRHRSSHRKGARRAP